MIQKAVNILRNGGLVAFATETVYGLGADASNALAIQKIFDAKGRPSSNPLIVHVADVEIAKRYVTAWPFRADQLVEKFWPGPLTLVLPKSPLIVSEVSAGRGTVGLRVPNHPLALQLLRAFNGAVAAPSANRSNHISPTSAADVQAELGDRVDLILDGGPCAVGIESTVIDLTENRPRILRPGGITREQIEQIIGPVDLFRGSADAETAAASPGQQPRHYSPGTPAFFYERLQRDQLPPQRDAVYLFIADVPIGDVVQNKYTLPNDPAAYAKELYHTLRVIDSSGYSAIYIELPPDEPRWVAVRDRLMRAAVKWSIGV